MEEKSQKTKREWVVLPFLWKGLKGLCMTLGAFMLVSMTISMVTLLSLLGPPPGPTSDNLVLYLEFDGGLEETLAEASLMDPFGPPQATLREYISAIEHAATDDRVKGIVARIKSSGVSLTHVQEIRTALEKFNANGDKFAYIYASSYGEGGGGLSVLYLASAFEERWIQPLGVVSIPGISAQIPFLKDALDKIGVGTQFYQRKKYKTAYESLTNSEISEANKEATQALVGDMASVLVPQIAKDLGVEPSAFLKMVNRGLYTAPEAVTAGLMTRADYADRLIEKINEQVTGSPDGEDILYVDVKKYNKMAVSEKSESKAKDGNVPTVALIYAVGAIMPDGGQAASVALGGKVAAADEIATAILAARDNDDVKAIVLRIDSPGGSPTASESILRALKLAQGKEKPVIVSMGAAAASGGYWIASGADRIFANAGTLTGSIGVVGGKFFLRDLWANIGINWAEVSWGDNAGMWSINSPFDEAEAERMNAMLDHVYKSFVDRVARGRKMEQATVEEVAQGRVWTGHQAKEIGLVDELGGLNDALDYAAQAVGEESRADIAIEIMPKPKTVVEVLAELLSGQVQMGQSFQVLAPLLDVLKPALEQADMAKNPAAYSVYQPLVLD